MINCNSIELDQVLPEIDEVILSDIDNNGDGSDLVVGFTAPLDETNIKEYRVILTEVLTQNLIDIETANELLAANYQVILPGNENVKVRLTTQARTVDGQLIKDGLTLTAYIHIISTNPKTPNSLSVGSNQIILATTDIVLTVTSELPAATGGICVDDQGNIFVADIGPVPNRGGSTIYKVTPEGEISIFASGNGLNGVSGNAFDSQGNLFQSNLNGNSISKITPDGTVTEFISEGINFPAGIAIDGDDNLFVLNCGNNTIQKITKDGTLSEFTSSNLFNCPNGITIGENGELFVANFNDGKVFHVSATGIVNLITEIPGGNNGHLTYHDQIIYVVSRGGHKIYKLKPTGEYSIFAGTGKRGHQDGSVLDATFSLPNDLAFSPDGGTIYINQVKPVVGTDNVPSILRKIILTN